MELAVGDRVALRRTPVCVDLSCACVTGPSRGLLLYSNFQDPSSNVSDAGFQLGEVSTCDPALANPIAEVPFPRIEVCLTPPLAIAGGLG